MRPVLIVGAAGWLNVGDDLIAQQLGSYVRANGMVPRLVGGPAVESVGPGFVMKSSVGSRLRLAGQIAGASAVLIGGGGLLDDRQSNFFRPFTRVASVARLARTPYAFIGLGVGPVRTDEAARAYRAAVAGAEAVMVRDSDSFQRLVEIGCDSAKIQIVGDPVLWGRQQRSSSTTRRWAVNLRQWSRSSADAGFGFDPDELVASLAEALTARVGRYDTVTLVSMSDLPGDDDKLPLDALRLAAGRSDWQIVTGADEAVRALEQAQGVISMRLHGCLVGARAGRAVLGLAYEPKVEQQAARCGFASLRGIQAADARLLGRAIDGMRPSDGLVEHVPEWPF
jgi:polysaccharide pyruvyl transferase WcaK-like protein